MPLATSIACDATGTAALPFDGDIDLASKGDHGRCVAATLGSARTSGVVIDRPDVALIDAVGIASLLRRQRLSDAAGEPDGGCDRRADGPRPSLIRSRPGKGVGEHG
jgi:hypothetical protein